MSKGLSYEENIVISFLMMANDEKILNIEALETEKLDRAIDSLDSYTIETFLDERFYEIKEFYMNVGRITESVVSGFGQVKRHRELEKEIEEMKKNKSNIHID